MSTKWKDSDAILRLKLHPGDESIGLDASVTHLPQGKRQINRDAKQVSNVPLPLNRSPFMVEMPYRNPDTNVAVDTDALLWKSYRAVVQPAGDQRSVGVKVYQQKMSSTKFQAGIRQGMRARLREILKKDQELQAEQEQQLIMQRERQIKRGEMEIAAARSRSEKKGFEGIRKPTLGSPPPDPKPSEEEVMRIMNTPLFGRTSGKKMVLDHVSGIDNGKPFGAQSDVPTEPMRRWDVKSLS